MAPVSPAWWTDDRVEEAVTSAYVHSHLRPNEQELLRRTLYFGGDLTDNTYLDWILTRAKRFFLILVAAGVPDQIFGIVDDSYDDDDLPIVESAVPDLRLAYEPDRALDRRFYKTQFRYLTRIVGEGEHIRYADEETVPVIPLSIKSVVLTLNHDKVRLPTEPPTVVLRHRVTVDAKTTEKAILAEIAASRQLCHEHVVSVFGSYLHQGTFSVLSLPAAEWSLKTFLTDAPKAFDELVKTPRRQILINWPHCLANALTWLHDNGEFHGAVRPSNIHVDEAFHISLGLMDGDGVLRTRAKADDIEAYQYGPPERWKRAVTVQSAATARVAPPSRGRTGRKVVAGKDQQSSSDGRSTIRGRSDSGAASYTFQPTSRGGYARLRLSAAASSHSTAQPSTLGRGSRTPTEAVSISSQSTPRPGGESLVLSRAPSIISSNSSNERRGGGAYNNSIFVAAPEGRSAVVQTWQSIEHDMFASDIFSLGAVILDILTLLCKRSHSSFARHRSAKNRMAGRGGGLADASFHANLGQVFLWAQSLQSEAEKKAKKDESQVFHAIGPVIQLTLQCLEREPTARLTSDQLEKRLGEYISRFASMPHLHCGVPPGRRDIASASALRLESAERYVREQQSIDRLRHPSPNPHSLTREWRRQQRLISPDAAALRHTVSRTPSSVTTTTPGTASASSVQSFNFDGLSDTVVNSSPQSREQSIRRPTRRATDARSPRVDIPWADEPDVSKRPFWNAHHNNDSQVDPRLSFGESVDTGVFTYLNYSTSASSEEGFKLFPRAPSSEPPPTKAPTRELPPLPPVQARTRNAKPRQRVARKPSHDDLGPSKTPQYGLVPTQTSRNDLAVLKQLSGAATGGRPPRLDSLSTPEDDDYHDMLRHTRRLHVAKESSRGAMRQERDWHYMARR